MRLAFEYLYVRTPKKRSLYVADLSHHSLSCTLSAMSDERLEQCAMSSGGNAECDGKVPARLWHCNFT
jgi:hypothetical protein